MTYTCSRCPASYTEEIPVVAHTPGEWTLVTPATADHDGLEELYCTVCGDKLDERAIAFVALDLTIEASATKIASATIDNAARTIDIVVKKGQAYGAFNLRLPWLATVTMTDAAFAAGNRMKIGGTVYDAETDAAGLRYMMSYAANGFHQTYDLVVTDRDGNEYVYTVNVEFLHDPAVKAIVAGYTADKTLTGISANDDRLIEVVSKAGRTETTFRLDVVGGARVRVISEDKPHIIQTTDNGATYVEVTEINDSVAVYFKTYKAEAVREFDIRVTFANGDYEDYHVAVTFVD